MAKANFGYGSHQAKTSMEVMRMEGRRTRFGGFEFLASSTLHTTQTMPKNPGEAPGGGHGHSLKLTENQTFPRDQK